MDTPHAIRIEIIRLPDAPDPQGRAVERAIRASLGLDPARVLTLQTYKILGALSPDELEAVRREFTDPVVDASVVGRLDDLHFDWAITVGLKPGVTDNVGRTARVAVEDTIGRPLTVEGAGAMADRPARGAGAVFTETTYLVTNHHRHPLSRGDVTRAARELLANELVQTFRVETREEWYGREPDLTLPLVAAGPVPEVETVDLDVADEELLRLSREGLLALSLEEMRAIRAYYALPATRAAREAAGLPPRPTDVELECLAQTWSEHCKHKIMNAVIRYRDGETGAEETIDSLFKSYIRRVTEELGPELGWLVSVFHDNAGVVRLNERLHLVYKVETHNSPSALDPYGGAMTGIVGVNRDPFGTGRGAALLANVWGYCFASPFHDGPVPEGLLHPRRIRDGVHQGVIDGGNQSGIPYARGWEYFDERFLGKPLVFCGTVGVMPHEVAGAPAEEKRVRAGDLIVMTGGRIGKDGIHGATFSSAELSEISPAQAVQIGDPITQKKMTDFLLEARDLGLYTAITDNGAGGLSSSVGEMARLSGGAEIDLARAPLKYAGLAPWEILLSEAQERMTLAVPPERETAFLELAARREVEATTLGRFTGDGVFLVRHGERVVGRIDMAFMHDGCPRMELRAEWTPPRNDAPPGDANAAADARGHRVTDGLAIPFSRALGALLARLNLASIEEKARQYDHEVKALTVVKPWVGARCDVPGDATVLLVEPGGREGVILAEGVCPRLSDVDAYAMAAWGVDLAVRRVVAAGGEPGRIAGLDNYCWPDPVESAATPDGRHKCAQLVRATRGLYDSCRALRVPLISGKDSMKNDSVRGGVKISIPPTLLVSTMGWTEDVSRAVTLDAKAEGDLVYVLGETDGALAASEYWAWLGESTRGAAYVGNGAPRFDFATTARLSEALARANREGLVRSAHAPGLGGLAAGLARVAIAGRLGIEVDLGSAPGAAEAPSDEARDASAPSDAALLFGEGPGRYLVTVAPESAARFEAILAGLPAARVGRVTAGPRLRVARGERVLVDAAIDDLAAGWKRTLFADEAGGCSIAAPEAAPDIAAGRPRDAARVASSVPGPKPRPRTAVRALVVTGFGLNCEVETRYAFELAGANAEMVHLSDLLAGKASLLDYHVLALIGGFAFGDHLGAGSVLANRLRYRLGEPMRRFVAEGRLVLAICNGFQTAAKLGLLPGLDGDTSNRLVTVTRNDSGVFRDAWVTLRAEPDSPCIFTRGLERLELPVRHGEGKFFTRHPTVLERIEEEHLAALRYADPATGQAARAFPHDPNGSLHAIAGLTNPTGRILGLMPHPEAHLSPLHHPHWTRRRFGGSLPEAGDGFALFLNAVDFARREVAGS